MVLPVAEALSNPAVPCLMGRCSPETREKWKGRYRLVKKYDIRAAFVEITGIGVVSIAAAT